MQQDKIVSAFRHVISMERLVKEVGGLQTPDLYASLKHYAINRTAQWEVVVGGMTELSVVDQIQWCEVFLEDLLLLHQHTMAFEKSMIERGADLGHPLGSQEHEHKKLYVLLYKGENAVFSEDVCEDVLLRSARRLDTLVGWAHEVCICVYMPVSYLRTYFVFECAGMHAAAYRTGQETVARLSLIGNTATLTG